MYVCGLPSFVRQSFDLWWSTLLHSISLSISLKLSISRRCCWYCCCSRLLVIFRVFFFSTAFFSWPHFIMRSRSLVFIYVLGAVTKDPRRDDVRYSPAALDLALCARDRYIISNSGLVSLDLNSKKKKRYRDTNDVELKF